MSPQAWIEREASLAKAKDDFYARHGAGLFNDLPEEAALDFVPPSYSGLTERLVLEMFDIDVQDIPRYLIRGKLLQYLQWLRPGASIGVYNTALCSRILELRLQDGL